VRSFCRPRRYEACWEQDESVAEEVKVAWEGDRRPSDLGGVASNLNGVMDCLQIWSKKNVGSVSKHIEKLRKRLEILNIRFLWHEQEKNRK
jgi:hypothetical protein